MRLEPFGAFLALGIGLGLLLADRLARASGLDRGLGASAFVTAAIAALGGARLLYVAESPARESFFELLALGRGGLSGYGAVLLGLLVFAALVARSGATLRWLDVAAAGVLLAAAVTRLGCALAGCDAAVAPYESALLLLLTAMLVLGRRAQRQSGQTLLAAAIGYALVRAGLELALLDAPRRVLGLLTVTQAAALASVLLVSIAFFSASGARPDSAPPPRRTR